MQFRLSTLLLSFVVVAMAMATFHAWGILASIILLASIAWIRRGRSRGGRFLMAAGGWLFALFVVSAGTGDMHPAAHGIQCANNLYQIGRALAVCQGRGNLSPRVTTDARGTPLHSWRTSILPYLDQQALFSVLKLSESWNSASNRKCVCEIATYVCPTANRRKGMRTTTNYLALVIPDQPWPPPQQIGGTKELNPVMVIEVASSGIEWMEPRHHARRGRGSDRGGRRRPADRTFSQPERPLGRWQRPPHAADRPQGDSSGLLCWANLARWTNWKPMRPRNWAAKICFSCFPLRSWSSPSSSWSFGRGKCRQDRWRFPKRATQ